MAADVGCSAQAGSDGAIVPTWMTRAQRGADLGSAVGFGRNSSWRPEPGALVCTPGVCGPLPSQIQGGGLEEEVLKCVSQVFPPRGGVLAPGWTAQVWCHIGPASVQILPGQAVRPQGSGFSDQPLAPGRW